MRATGRFSTARLIEVGTSHGKFVPGVADIVPFTPRIEAEFGPPGRAVMAWTGADVDHPIVRAARTNASVLDAAQTVAAGALEALALGPRGEAILLWSDEAGGRGAASRHGPPTSAPGQAVATWAASRGSPSSDASAITALTSSCTARRPAAVSELN